MTFNFLKKKSDKTQNSVKTEYIFITIHRSAAFRNVYCLYYKVEVNIT